MDRGPHTELRTGRRAYPGAPREVAHDDPIPRQHTSRYNLHLVLVHEGRWSEVDDNVLAAVRDMLLKASRAKGHRLSRAGILADHVHVVAGCGLTESPLEVALGYLNNLAYAQGMKRVYQLGFYVGTVGEYDLDAIRRQVRQ